MLKQVEPTMVEVDGMKFYIRPFPAFKAANISGELASVLAPLLSGVFALLKPLWAMQRLMAISWKAL